MILGRKKSLENLRPINTRTPAERSEINQQAKAAEAELKTSTSQEDKIAELFDKVDGEINES